MNPNRHIYMEKIIEKYHTTSIQANQIETAPGREKMAPLPLQKAKRGS